MTPRTITMTGRRPVRIDEEQWPTIARAMGDSWGCGADGAQHAQALSQGELDRYYIRVRHGDGGRVIVSAVLDGAAAWTGTRDRRGGVMIDAPADAEIVAAIVDVGRDVGIPDGVVRECIADLPAEEV